MWKAFVKGIEVEGGKQALVELTECMREAWPI